MPQKVPNVAAPAPRKANDNNFYQILKEKEREDKKMQELRDLD